MRWPGRAVVDRVLDQHVEDAVEVGDRAAHDATTSRTRSSSTPGIALDRAPRGGEQVGGGVRRPRRARLAQDQQLRDHARQSIHLLQRALDLLDGRPVGGRRRLLEPQPQPGQRRAQLVRRVGDEVALRVDHPLHARRHLVERARRPRAARSEPSTGTRTDRSPSPARRAANASRRSGRATDAGQQRARRQPERRARSGRPARARSSPTAPRAPTASTLCVMRTAPSGSPSRTIGTAVARISLRRASRCRAAPARIVRVSAARDLGARRVVLADRARARSRRRLARCGRRSPPARGPRAPTSRPARRARRSPAAVAATTSACPSACVSTSASTRSRTERTSGTSIDPIASTST